MLEEFLDNLAQKYIENYIFARLVSDIVTLTVIVIIAVITYYMVKVLVRCCAKLLINKAKSEYLHALASKISVKVFGHLVAALVFRLGSRFISRHDDLYTAYLALTINKLSMLYLFFAIIIIITGTIRAIDPYYEYRFKSAARYPIKPYLNVVIFIVWIFSAIFIVAFFTGSSLTNVLTGIGAASAVFLLIFRDTLLGIVSSIQAAASNIVRVGDRIAIDKYTLDGFVLNISISNVRIRNLDNTVATIPTYMLTSEVVKNFRTVAEFGYRRIKRAVLIDIKSIKVLSADEIKSFAVSRLVANYKASNTTDKIITNLELFRLCIEDYLHRLPYINKNSDLAVYHLPATANGLPVEIYAFTSLLKWSEYEHLQSQIMEYCLIKMHEFSLVAYQS